MNEHIRKRKVQVQRSYRFEKERHNGGSMYLGVIGAWHVVDAQ